MTLRVEVNPDGTLHYISDGPIVLTGPVNGTVDLPGGKTVNVTPAVVEVADDAEAVQLANAIGEKLMAEGHPDFIRDPEVDSYGFVAVPAEIPEV